MTFSKEWEEQFKSGGHFSLYPWSDLVTLVMRHANPKNYNHRPRALELGPGVGANISFFLDKGFDYHAVEGSETAVKHIRERYGDSVKVEVGDFTKSIPFEAGTFDLVADRGAITHNDTEGIKGAISLADQMLVSKGIFIVVDWFSTRHPLFQYGTELEPGTKTEIPYGTLKDVGKVHFFTEDELGSLFSKDFDILYLAHKTYETLMPDRESGVAFYNLVARKKK